MAAAEPAGAGGAATEPVREGARLAAELDREMRAGLGMGTLSGRQSLWQSSPCADQSFRPAGCGFSLQQLVWGLLSASSSLPCICSILADLLMSVSCNATKFAAESTASGSSNCQEGSSACPTSCRLPVHSILAHSTGFKPGPAGCTSGWGRVARMRRQPSATSVAANRPKPCTPLLQARPEHLCKAAELLERGRVC